MQYPYNDITNLPVVNKTLAITLKTLGFNYPTTYFFYEPLEPLCSSLKDADYNNYRIEGSNHISAPFLDHVEKWLRDIHNIRNINVFSIYENNVFKEWGFIQGLLTFDNMRDALKNGRFDTYEKAQEAAIISIIKNSIAPKIHTKNVITSFLLAYGVPNQSITYK